MKLIEMSDSSHIRDVRLWSIGFMLDAGCGLKTELVRKLLLEAKIGLG